MTLQIDLSPELEARLRQRAAAAGKHPEEFVLQAVEEKLQAPRSFRDIFAPLHEAFSRGTMTEEETDRLLEGALAQIRLNRPADAAGR